MGWTTEEEALLRDAGAVVLTERDGEAVALAIVEQAFPWAAILAPLVLLDENTSDYPALVRAGPIAGYVVHFRHDQEPVVLCRTIDDYLDAVRRTGELPRDTLLDPTGERTADEELAAQHLVANAFDEDDWAALALAIPLIRENVGLLVALAQVEEVAELAEARLRRVASPEQRRAIAEGRPPAPWPVPDEVRPTVEVELSGWTRSQLGFEEAVLTGSIAVEREGEARILVLEGEVDLTAFLDAALPEEPASLGFLEAIGTWGQEEDVVGELRWFSARHVRLTVGEELLYDWTR